MNARHRRGAVTLALVALAVFGVARAAERTNASDKAWVHPDYARLEPASIGMLWPSSFSNNFEAEKLADGTWGAAIRSKGYRFLGATASRVLLQPAGTSDSLAKAVRESIVKHGRVDSLLAPVVCRKLRVAAVLSLHVDRWEQMEIEFNQTGKPSTTVALASSLVDSSGRLLWRASGTEFAEGPMHDASANVLGVKSSGLGNTPVTGQGGPPAYAEVATSLVTRFAKTFPVRGAHILDSPLTPDSARR